MFIRASNFQPFKRTSSSKDRISLGNKTDFKANIFDSITCNFSSIHDIKNCCLQSEILRTVNSTSSFNFVHLAKNYGALHFMEVYHSVFDMMILLVEAVTNLLAAQIDFVAFKHKIHHYARLAIFWLYSVQCFQWRLKQWHCVLATPKPHYDIRRALEKWWNIVSKCLRA